MNCSATVISLDEHFCSVAAVQGFVYQRGYFCSFKNRNCWGGRADARPSKNNMKGRLPAASKSEVFISSAEFISGINALPLGMGSSLHFLKFLHYSLVKSSIGVGEASCNSVLAVGSREK